MINKMCYDKSGITVHVFASGQRVCACKQKHFPLDDSKWSYGIQISNRKRKNKRVPAKGAA